MHLGSHMMNNPQLTVPKDDKGMNVFNVRITHNLAPVAKKPINVGDGIYGDYQYL